MPEGRNKNRRITAGMKNLDRYLKEIKRGIPDIETRLNAGADEGRLCASCTIAESVPAV